MWRAAYGWPPAIRERVKVLTSDADGDASWQKAGYGAVELFSGNVDVGNIVGFIQAGDQIVLPEVQDDDGRYADGKLCRW